MRLRIWAVAATIGLLGCWMLLESLMHGYLDPTLRKRCGPDRLGPRARPRVWT